MKKLYHPWNDNAKHYDSESESTPLLSSESPRSTEAAIFQNSETSNSDQDHAGSSHSRNSSIENGSYNSTVTILPRRLPPLMQDNALFPSPTANMPVSVILPQERCYKIRDINKSTSQDACKSIKPKQNSLVTIFSIWNTILGSSLLTIPWGIRMAGFFPGIFLILAMSALCLYTAYCLLLVHRYHGGGEKVEVMLLSRIYLNKGAEYVAQIFSIAVLLGATIAYWILMSNFLYNSVNYIYDSVIGVSYYSVTTNQSYADSVLCPRKIILNGTNVVTIRERTFDVIGPAWDLYKTVPIFLSLLIYPLLNFKSPTFFTKFNSLGTASILYLIIFVVVKSASWGINMEQAEWQISWLLKPTFPALSGMLTMSFFIHNIIITIMQNNQDQQKNGRDLLIAYILVTLTYIIIGISFYVCFPLQKSCISDNLLNNFLKWDGLTVGARIVLLFQLLTVYPLLAYMLRIQLISFACKSIHNRGLIFIINLVIVIICILFATFIPYIGTIIRYTGALSGLIYVFTLPSLLYLVVQRKQRMLTVQSCILHLTIPLLGAANLIAQFFINDH
ncbi:hypothetical protein KM043_006182 [Ampulex compressa]|nr:hypothetical protein KM043_006182 [Ampulex compressa]